MLNNVGCMLYTELCKLHDIWIMLQSLKKVIHSCFKGSRLLSYDIHSNIWENREAGSQNKAKDWSSNTANDWVLQYSMWLGVAIQQVTGCCNIASDWVMQYSKWLCVAIQEVTGCCITASDSVLQYSKQLGVAIQEVTGRCNTESDRVLQVTRCCKKASDWVLKYRKWQGVVIQKMTGCCTPLFSPGNSRHLAKGGAVQLILAAV